MFVIHSCHKVELTDANLGPLERLAMEKIDTFDRPTGFEHKPICRAVLVDPNNSNKIYYSEQRSDFETSIWEWELSTRRGWYLLNYKNNVSSLDINSFGQLLIRGYGKNGDELVCVDVSSGDVQFKLNSPGLAMRGGIWQTDSTFSLTMVNSRNESTVILYDRKGKIIDTQDRPDNFIGLSAIRNESFYYTSKMGTMYGIGKYNVKSLAYQNVLSYSKESIPLAFVPTSEPSGFWFLQASSRHLMWFDEAGGRLLENSVFKSNIVLNGLSPYGAGDEYLVAVSIYSPNSLRPRECIGFSNMKDNILEVLIDLK